MTVKPKPCRICRNKFTPKNSSLEVVCDNYDCKVTFAMQVVAKQKIAKEKKVKQKNAEEKNILREKLKTKSDYEKELQKEINTIVRLIDKDFVCISTSKPLNSKFDAGHFYSCGSNPTIRFNLFNIYAQSVHANQHLSGDQINFLEGLKTHYGAEHAEYVLSLKSIYKLIKLTQDELKEKIVTARQIVKALKALDLSYTTDQRIKLRHKYNAIIGIYT